MEIIEAIHPYIKYILYFILIVGGLFINKKFVTDPKLRAWLMQSFEENGRASGKALSAFVCTFSLVIGFFVSIHYGDKHTPPEWYFLGMIGLVTSLYGIKEYGKVMTTKYSNNSPTKLTEEELQKKWKESGTNISFEDWKIQNPNL